jgi:toxin YoeB
MTKGKFKFEITDEAELDILRHLKSGNKSCVKKINSILIELTINPYLGIGKPEALKFNLSG